MGDLNAWQDYEVEVPPAFYGLNSEHRGRETQ
jgi:hypothetical protein